MKDLWQWLFILKSFVGIGKSEFFSHVSIITIQFQTKIFQTTVCISVCMYHITSNYGWSHINAWSCLVDGEIAL